jgi:hypothetical protein
LIPTLHRAPSRYNRAWAAPSFETDKRPPHVDVGARDHGVFDCNLNFSSRRLRNLTFNDREFALLAKLRNHDLFDANGLPAIPAGKLGMDEQNPMRDENGSSSKSGSIATTIDESRIGITKQKSDRTAEVPNSETVLDFDRG